MSRHYNQFVLIAEIIVNIFTVVGIIVMNKRIQIHHAYPYMVALSSMHFFVTSLALRAMLYTKMFEYKHVPLKYVVMKAALDCASTTFMNLNLANNSVGTYQISKLCLIPVTVLMQLAFWGEKISTCTAQVLTVLCLAIGIATVTDINITAHGIFWAVAAILATVYSQILTTLYLRNLGCSAMQLLLLTSPWISGFMLLMVPHFDGVPSLATPFLSATAPAAAADIAASCVLAVAVNLTNYLVLGRTSPLTYQVRPPRPRPAPRRPPRRAPPARAGAAQPIEPLPQLAHAIEPGPADPGPADPGPADPGPENPGPGPAGHMAHHRANPHHHHHW